MGFLLEKVSEDTIPKIRILGNFSDFSETYLQGQTENSPLPAILSMKDDLRNVWGSLTTQKLPSSGPYNEG